MSDPISELIVQGVVDALATIQTESGYQHDTSVYRSDVNGVPRGKASSGNQLVVTVTQTLVAQDIAPITKDGYRMVVAVDLTVAQGDALETPTDTLLLRLECDVRRCLGRNYTFGGYAYNSTPQGTLPGMIGAMTAIRIPIEIIFWTAKDNPFSQ